MGSPSALRTVAVDVDDEAARHRDAGIVRGQLHHGTFRPTEREHGPATQVRVADVSESDRYFFVTPPSSPVRAKATLEERRETGAACAKLDEDKDGLFYAVNERIATQATWQLQTVVRKILDGTAGFKVTCSYFEEQKQTCVDVAKELPRVQPSWVYGCDDTKCSIDTGASEFVVSYEQGAPEKITVVDLTMAMVIADPSMD